MTKVKVIEIDVAKLDPNAAHLIVFNAITMSQSDMFKVAEKLDSLGIKAAYTMNTNPQNAVKVYEIPKKDSET